MKIGIVSQHDTGVDFHRLLAPFSLLNHEVTRLEGANEELFDMDFDVVVFSRMLPVIKQKRFIIELKRRGVYVICDVDDYWILPTYHVGKGAGEAFKKLHLDALIYSDEIWTTHELLKSFVTHLNGNVWVIPNAINPEDKQWRPKEKYQNRIGWAGGITHFKDLMLTDGCFSRPPYICGFKDEREWKKLADNFEAHYIEHLDVFEYGYLYEYFDIALAPLVRNRFNKCKSNLKIIEAGLKGLPIFVEDVHPYTDNARGIYKVNDWRESIKQAEDMGVDGIQEEGQALREYVLENYDLRKVNGLRDDRLASL